MLQADVSSSLPHAEHLCFLVTSSEKISFSFPHEGHLQERVWTLLFNSFPGHLVVDVVMIETSFWYG